MGERELNIGIRGGGAEETGEEWRGDNMTDKGPGMVRMAQFNFDAFGLSEESQRKQTEWWVTAGELQLDVIGGQDHRYDERGRNTLRNAAGAWGEIKSWEVEKGMRGGEGRLIGGVALGVARTATEWSNSDGKNSRAADSRGWGTWVRKRYAMKGGKHLAIYSMYVPCKSSSNEGGLWSMMEERLARARSADARDPKLAALDDMMDDLDKQPSGTEAVIMTDANIVWSHAGKEAMSSEDVRYMRALRKRCEERGIVNAWHERHGESQGAWTCSGTSKTQIDHVLMSSGLADNALVKIGVMTTKMNSSAHRPVVVDLDIRGAMMQEEAGEEGDRTAQLQLDNQKALRRFQRGVLAAVSRTEAHDAMTAAEELGTDWEGWEEQPLDARQQAALRAAQGILHKITAVAQQQLRVKANSRRKGRKNCWSPEYVERRKHARKITKARQAAAVGNLERARRIMGKPVRRGMRNKVVPVQQCPAGRKSSEWRKWREWAAAYEKGLIREMHGRQRAKARRAISEWATKREKAYRSGKCRRALDADLKRGGRSAPLTSLIREDGTKVTGKDEVLQETEEEVAKWFGKGRAKWFLGTRIHADNEDGRALRRRIAGGELDAMSRDATEEEMRKAVPAEDMQAVLMEVPTRCWKVLKAARVKAASDGTSMAEKYTGMINRQQVFNPSQWRRMWGGKKAGTAPGRTGLSVNMMKALQTAMVEEVEGKKVKRCETLWVTDLIRRLCNLMLRIHKFDNTWKESAMVLIPKEVGSKRLKKQRPICMLEVLRNACVGDVVRRVSRVWEREGALYDNQHAFQRAKGTEGPLTVRTTVAEDACRFRKPLYALDSDISKAYDKVERTIGKDMSMRRMGVPEWILGLIAALDTGFKVFVRTGWGETGEVRTETGWPQGSEEGPTGWNSQYDWLVQLHLEDPKRDPYVLEDVRGSARYGMGSAKLGPHSIAGLSRCTEACDGDESEDSDSTHEMTSDSEDAPESDTKDGGAEATEPRMTPQQATAMVNARMRELTTPGEVFADDAWFTSRSVRGIQRAADLSEDFFGFGGQQFNPEKSSVTGIRWRTGDRYDPGRGMASQIWARTGVCDPEGKDFISCPPDIYVTRIPDVGEEEVRVVLLKRDAHEATKYLGVQVTDSTWWGEEEEMAGLKA